ncbi:uncharacterized protein LOC119688436 [Teleopsis dalmanni]|uniref:uncharacterized protein LOC119688436 n=1 Tax=Teleopsis dalmanni TaxID=139649 RepID=UPI0018CCA170|nr:uncharacterized protein LOC119688436 [Teleopsis dalmanni]
MSNSQYLFTPPSADKLATKSSDDEEDEINLRRGFDPEWIERNCQPKRWYYPQEKREITKWQKSGPMGRNDWVRFYKWASKNAVPRELPEPKKEPATADTKQTKKKSDNKTMEHLNKLSKPKNPREKYKFPEKKVFSYSPKTNTKNSARKEPRRPFEKPKVPEQFYHIDNETEFWSTLRFPVAYNARNYKATPHMKELAQPRIPNTYNIHCPLSGRKCEEIPVRKKMSKRQWIEHMHRLEYLAKPNIRNDFESCICLDPCRCMYY